MTYRLRMNERNKPRADWIEAMNAMQFSLPFAVTNVAKIVKRIRATMAVVRLVLLF